MNENTTQLQYAIIDEDECIGCTKCIHVCPTDAIIGAAQHMHTVITEACIGCQLCLPPCPVDCITLKPREPIDPIEKRKKVQAWRTRHQKRKQRLADEKRKEENNVFTQLAEPLSERKKTILEAVARSRAKKNLKTT